MPLPSFQSPLSFNVTQLHCIISTSLRALSAPARQLSSLINKAMMPVPCLGAFAQAVPPPACLSSTCGQLSRGYSFFRIQSKSTSFIKLTLIIAEIAPFSEFTLLYRALHFSIWFLASVMAPSDPYRMAFMPPGSLPQWVELTCITNRMWQKSQCESQG